MNRITSVEDAAQVANKLSEISQAARYKLDLQLKEILPLYYSENPNIRAIYYSRLREIYTSLIKQYGPSAQSLAAEVLDAQGVSLDSTADIDSIYDADLAIKGAVNLKEGNPGAGYIAGVIDYAIKYAYRQMIMNSGGRWARIPTGSYTCPFCVMLASRGFVYHSKATAGGMTKFHNFCDCAVICESTEKKKELRMIKGYDPDALYDIYINGPFSPKSKGKDPSEIGTGAIGVRPDRKPKIDINGNEAA